ncbi:hypothetical protein DSO57_1015444 [Entomophthora muscae]|uniref:Uncharacterized protein n=1 Tax=Entomophthora muscae TaxID=34485 RepID=A0ACC2U386_9FUNG|nr:hypothetical protein DSO57_1015444 [Entomophthora muscae]
MNGLLSELPFNPFHMNGTYPQMHLHSNISSEATSYHSDTSSEFSSSWELDQDSSYSNAQSSQSYVAPHNQASPPSQSPEEDIDTIHASVSEELQSTLFLPHEFSLSGSQRQTFYQSEDLRGVHRDNRSYQPFASSLSQILNPISTSDLCTDAELSHSFSDSNSSNDASG